MGINWLANRIGRLVCLDENTEKLERIQYAKCLIEVTPYEELLNEFAVKLPDGATQTVKVEYRWKPDICVSCKAFGHVTNSCETIDRNEQNMHHHKSKVHAEELKQKNEHGNVQLKRTNYEKVKKVWTKVTTRRDENNANFGCESHHNANDTLHQSAANNLDGNFKAKVNASASTHGPKNVPTKVKPTSSNKFDVLSTIQEEEDEQDLVFEEVALEVDALGEHIQNQVGSAATGEPIPHTRVQADSAATSEQIDASSHSQVQVDNSDSTLEHTLNSTELHAQATSVVYSDLHAHSGKNTHSDTHAHSASHSVDLNVNSPPTSNLSPLIDLNASVFEHTDTQNTASLLSIGKKSLFSSSNPKKTLNNNNNTSKNSKTKGNKTLKLNLPHSKKNTSRNKAETFNSSDNSKSLPANIYPESSQTSKRSTRNSREQKQSLSS